MVPVGGPQSFASPSPNPSSTPFQPSKSTPPVSPTTSSKQKTGSESTSTQSPSSKSHVKSSTVLKTDSGQSTRTAHTQEQSTLHPRSSHPHPTLLLTLVSFLTLLPVIVADILPLRLLSFLVGTGAVCALHPNVHNVLTNVWTSRTTLSSSNLSFSASIPIPSAPRPRLRLPFWRVGSRTSLSERRCVRFRVSPKIARTALRRLVDNDRLSDKAWPAPMCIVELWENERWGSVGGMASGGGKRSSFLGGSGWNQADIGGDGDEVEDGGSKSKQKVPPPQGTWSKTHLRPSERAPWTRGRDGWSGVGGEIRWVVSLYH